MRNFNWPGTNLFNGSYISAKLVPWHYTLVWIAITTPLSILVFFLIGMTRLPRLIRNLGYPYEHLNLSWIAVFIWCCLPLLLVIVLQSTLYDGWRQLYFIYPAMILIAVMGLKEFSVIISNIESKFFSASLIYIVIALVSLDFGQTISFMIRSHPHQYVYFNSLVGGTRGAKGLYELDYWGLSFRQLLDCVSKSVPEGSRVAVIGSGADTPMYHNLEFLKTEYKEKLLALPTTDSLDNIDYQGKVIYLTTFRWRPVNWNPPYPKVCEVKVDGTTIAVAYLVKK